MRQNVSHTDTEISLATSIYHEFFFQSMLTPSQEKLLEDATVILRTEKLVNDNDEWINDDGGEN